LHSFFAINRLSAYIDGELPDSEAAEVERAIAADPSVRNEYETMLSTVELLRTRGPVQAPPSLHSLILARVADEPDPVVGFWARLLAPFHAIPMEAVGVVFAVVAVVVLINQEPGVDSPPADPAPLSVEAFEGKPDTESVVTQPPPKLASRPDQPAPPSPEAGLPAKPMGASAARSTRGGSEDVTQKNDKSNSKRSAGKQAPQQQQKIAPPKQAYSPEWEQQGEDHSTGFAEPETLYNQPYYYRLDPTDQHGLTNLQRLASKFGGSLKYVDGRAFQPHVLQDGDLMELRADIPSDQVAGFASALKQLGMVVPMQSDGARLHAGMTQVRVQVRFNP
jgi:negative regulator of sigma E activity